MDAYELTRRNQQFNGDYEQFTQELAEFEEAEQARQAEEAEKAEQARQAEVSATQSPQHSISQDVEDGQESGSDDGGGRGGGRGSELDGRTAGSKQWPSVIYYKEIGDRTGLGYTGEPSEFGSWGSRYWEGGASDIHTSDDYGSGGYSSKSTGRGGKRGSGGYSHERLVVSRQRRWDETDSSRPRGGEQAVAQIDGRVEAGRSQHGQPGGADIFSDQGRTWESSSCNIGPFNPLIFGDFGGFGGFGGFDGFGAFGGFNGFGGFNSFGNFDGFGSFGGFGEQRAGSATAGWGLGQARPQSQPPPPGTNGWVSPWEEAQGQGKGQDNVSDSDGRDSDASSDDSSIVDNRIDETGYGHPHPNNITLTRPQPDDPVSAFQGLAASRFAPSEFVPKSSRRKDQQPKQWLLPVAFPSMKYWSTTFAPPSMLAKPRPLLVVLDMNGTLIYRKSKGSKNFIKRPKLAEFLDYLFAHHEVMVWSSARSANVVSICQQVFKPSQLEQLIAIWARDKLRIPAHLEKQRIQVYKQLSWIWEDEKIQARLPVQNYFNQANTVLIDDGAGIHSKAVSEPFNVIELEEFEGREDQMQTDVLNRVAWYLETLKMQADVRLFMRQTPFA